METTFEWSSILITLHCFITVVLGVISAYLFFVLLPQKVKQAGQSANIQVPETSCEQEEQIREMKKQLNEKDKKIEEYRKITSEFVELIKLKPTFTKDTDVENGEALEEFISKYLGIYSSDVDTRSMNAYFMRQRKGLEAYEILRRLKGYMFEMQTELQNQTPPITDIYEKRKNLAILLNMGMVAYDYVTTFNTINVRDEQNLNKMIMDKTLTIEQALPKARQMTNVTTETPRWIIVIKDSVEWTGVMGVIYSGYKL